jgi:methionyl-tRNA formyltransferase
MSLVFIGCVEIGFTCLQGLIEAGFDAAGVATLPPEAARDTSGYVDFAPFCRERDIPLLQTRDVNDPESIAWIAERRPKLLVVCGWQRLLSPTLLRVAQHGTVGFHSSLLPRYRGRAPVNWAVMRGEKKTGVTMFFLEPEADAGPILGQREFAVAPFDTCGDVYQKSARALTEMLVDKLPQLLRGELRGRDNPSRLYPCMPGRTPADGLIDWRTPAQELHNIVRALAHPYPGAFTDTPGGRYFIWQAAPLHPGLGLGLAPGETLCVPGLGVIFGCGRGEALLASSGQFQDGPEQRPDQEAYFRNQAPPTERKDIS